MSILSPTADIADLLDELRQAAEAVLSERETYTPSIVEYAVECLTLLEARDSKLRKQAVQQEEVARLC